MNYRLKRGRALLQNGCWMMIPFSIGMPTATVNSFHATSALFYSFIPSPTTKRKDFRQRITLFSFTGDGERGALDITRREGLFGGAILLIPKTAFADERPTSVAEDFGILRSTPELKDCQNGALVSEQAIPGAYEQICMGLSERTVPIKMSGNRTAMLRLEQDRSGAGSTGMAVWNSSLLLTRLLETLEALQPGWIKNGNVLELGCGVGLVSLTAAILGAARVVATDGNPKVVELASRNIQANGYADCVKAQTLSWGLLDAMDNADQADWLVGSDLTYNAANWRVLAESMATIVKQEGYILYVSLGHAAFDVNAETQGFLSVAKEMGLIEVVHTDANWPFPNIKTSLTEVLLRDCVQPMEHSIVSLANGGRVMLLQRKSTQKWTKSR